MPYTSLLQPADATAMPCSPMRRGKEVKLQPAEPAALVAELRDDRTRVLTSLLLAPR